MTRNAEATRRRLLDAATAEFAAHGIAGARVDRIAKAARSNKAQIYHYFESKDRLFDAAFHDLVVATVRDIPIDADDLPGYAGRLFDGYEKNPDVLRLATWYRLERSGNSTPLDIIVSSNRDKLAKIENAQRLGTLPMRWTASDLLLLVVHTASMWTTIAPEIPVDPEHDRRETRREVVMRAVRSIVYGD